jgi:hypothetical protein
MRTEAERFWSKVDKRGRCWIWTASKDEKGYGLFHRTRKNGKEIKIKAHKWAWEQENGSVPDDMVLDHIICDNPSCVRPSHLALSSHAANILRSTRSVAGVNARKTHCPQGHEYTTENTIMVTNGPGYRGRSCKTCRRNRRRELRRTRRA